MKPVEAVLIGAGQRGREAVGEYARKNPDKLKFIAVVEPDEGRRKLFAEIHNIPEEKRYTDYREFFKESRIAPLCFNATMDSHHEESAMMALEKDYDLFLEKPMTPTPEGCLRILEMAKKRKRLVQICHPLRYTNFYTKIKELLEEKSIGDVISISMFENVAYWHYAHSFVRGNWGKEEESGPFILTKCCHDMDIAVWMADSSPEHVSSFGDLKFFHSGNAPEEAPPRCTDGCVVEDTCPFYAPAVYLTENIEWPVSAVSLDKSLEARRKALEEGPYGRCVFKCGNDVVDHQTATINFENGVIASFSVYANSFYPYRSIRIIGTGGEINGHLEKREISVLRFGQGCGDWFGNSPEPEIIETEPMYGGHGGGDTGVVNHFLECYHNNDHDQMMNSLEIAVNGHLLSFALEEARRRKETIAIRGFRERNS